jgi:glutaryl-CoA dehydrogenase
VKFKGTDYYQLDDLFSDEEKILRSSVREFLEKEIEPLVVKSFDREEPLNLTELAPRMGELGLLGTFVPTEEGGPGGSYVDFGLVCQEVERVDSSLRSFVAVQSGLVMYPIWQFGSEEQKRKWLPTLASGQKIGCFGLTEPNAGSDPASLETKAKKIGETWVLNGEKQWISESSIADIALVWAKTDNGILGFLIERGSKGFSQTFQSRKGSLRAGDVGSLILSDCQVKSDDILPSTKGLKSILMCLNHARYGISWGAIGVAMSCYETALNYAKERKQFGAPIASYQLVQEKLVNMLIEITKGQLLAHRLGRLMDERKAKHTQISLAKKNNVAIARMCARTAREILGANGISYDFPPIRHMANIESVYTYEGTDDIHTLIIGQDITGIPAFGHLSEV